MSQAAALPRFALLRHECPADYRDGPHWDLMLERTDLDAEHRLATWSLLRLPTQWTGRSSQAADSQAASAVRLPDHRAAYLEYEGPISGGRGVVARVAGGTMEWVEACEALVVVRLHGASPFVGEWELRRGVGDDWTLTARHDESVGHKTHEK